MPARGGQTFEHRFLGSSFIKMERLRIEFGGETLDIISRDFGFATLVAHADCQVVEPLDHDILPNGAWKYRAPVGHVLICGRPARCKRFLKRIGTSSDAAICPPLKQR